MKTILTLITVSLMALLSTSCGWFEDEAAAEAPKTSKVTKAVEADPSIASRVSVAKGKLDIVNKGLDKVAEDIDSFKKAIGDPEDTKPTPVAPKPKK